MHPSIQSGGAFMQKTCTAALLAKKELLTDAHRASRLAFAEQHANKGLDFWSQVIFCDEKTFRSSDHGILYVSNRFDVLGALGDPVELWYTFKRETLQAAKECIGERPRSRRGFVSTETLEKSRRVALPGWLGTGPAQGSVTPD
ncbi:hypothetical protein GWK47_031366 [Chionoecetes opilio]|uniref:Uncharacterized protein n=1 Tax=Chionoecetes opilio TaxID=41210 RepID=A0A8J4YR25_CHIOP|nr:hypothetical protein GWK47_031366 [Chionoecetes opilio]